MHGLGVWWRGLVGATGVAGWMYADEKTQL